MAINATLKGGILYRVALYIARAVAQICNLPYRRVALCVPPVNATGNIHSTCTNPSPSVRIPCPAVAQICNLPYRRVALCAALILTILFPFYLHAAPKPLQLLNASYDPTRELYTEINAAFVKSWFQKTGQTVSIKQSHGGSAKQARAVMDGLRADVVTLALAYDIDVIAARAKMLPVDWQARLPNNSTPYTSTVVFLVRKGNPKGIHDWPDLVKKDLRIITPNPRTSGGARWNYLAAWGYALKKTGTDEGAFQFVSELFSRVPILETGARGAATTFLQRKIGDVLITWENEAILAMKESSAGEVELVRPSVSILAEPSVAWVDRVTDRKGTRDVARAYLEYLYTDEGQAIIAKHHFRPNAGGNASKKADQDLFTIDELFGGWQKAQKAHFTDGGSFDKIQQSRR